MGADADDPRSGATFLASSRLARRRSRHRAQASLETCRTWRESAFCRGAAVGDQAGRRDAQGQRGGSFSALRAKPAAPHVQDGPSAFRPSLRAAQAARSRTRGSDVLRTSRPVSHRRPLAAASPTPFRPGPSLRNPEGIECVIVGRDFGLRGDQTVERGEYEPFCSARLDDVPRLAKPGRGVQRPRGSRIGELAFHARNKKD